VAGVFLYHAFLEGIFDGKTTGLTALLIAETCSILATYLLLRQYSAGRKCHIRAKIAAQFLAVGTIVADVITRFNARVGTPWEYANAVSIIAKALANLAKTFVGVHVAAVDILPLYAAGTGPIKTVTSFLFRPNLPDGA